MNILIEYLKEQQAEWLCTLNAAYKTDGGTLLQEAAKGRLAAYTELLNWIEEKEKRDGNTFREERAPRKETETLGGVA
jgi:hypothetical protein|tara:strand:+ start:2793 stop:3026 length:234 start_codon:yes stop_codon:yes gene_type:complete